MGTLDLEKECLAYIRDHYLPTRLTLLLYFVGKSRPEFGHYPMNAMRSFGISNVETSHYIVMDIDLHVSSTPFPRFSNSEHLLRNDAFTAVYLRIELVAGDSPHLLHDGAAAEMRKRRFVRSTVRFDR